jgi:hypothetical protein
MPDKWIIAANVRTNGKVVEMGAIWDGSVLKTVRAKAAVFVTAEEAASQQFYVSCKYPLLTERIEVVKVEDDPEHRYHLIGGIDIRAGMSS